MVTSANCRLLMVVAAAVDIDEAVVIAADVVVAVAVVTDTAARLSDAATVTDNSRSCYLSSVTPSSAG